MRYWEDFEAGTVERFGAYEVTEAEIIEFGKAFDPLPFHVDPQAAQDGPYGGLTAPGLLVCSIFMRLLVDNVLSEAASRGSPGVESVDWRLPVRPGDVLGVRLEVAATRVLESRPDMGLVNNRFEIRNQHDEVVCEIRSSGLFARRAPQGASA